MSPLPHTLLSFKKKTMRGGYVLIIFFLMNLSISFSSLLISCFLLMIYLFLKNLISGHVFIQAAVIVL